jgi:hypothetical protein
MIRNTIPSKRKTVTLAVARWDAIDKYQKQHGILTATAALDRLVADGLTVKVATVNKNARRKSI